MKKLFVLFILLTISIFAANTLYAAQIGVIIDGEAVSFANQQPVVINGRVLVPIADIAEHLGYEFEWIESVQTAMLCCQTQVPQSVVVLTMNSQVFTANGIMHWPDIRAQIINDTPMLPIRAVAETMGHQVAWCGEQNAVVITPIIPPLPDVDYILIRDRRISTMLTTLDLSGMYLQDYEIEPLQYMVRLTTLEQH